MPFSSDQTGGDEVLDIFIVGPMSAAEDAATSAAVPDHIPNLELATRAALAELGVPEAMYEIDIPQRLAGSSIINDVFSKLDGADFALADISTRSPNVFYEVAILQALGTPLVLIDLQGQDLPFYWQQQRVTNVKSFAVETLKAELARVFGAFIDPTIETDVAESPISAFYGVPLVDISAAQGLALGYFENFVEPVLRRRVGALAENAGTVADLVILRPRQIDDHGHDWDQVVERMRQTPGLQLDPNVQLKCTAHKRGAIRTATAGDAIVDLPTALYTLHGSPRYRRLFERLRKAGIGKDVMDAKLVKMKSHLIDAFFRSLEEQIDSAPDLDTVHFRIIDIDAFPPSP